jgi:D-alanyl-lipoteichoic acid acyltransferase DltB (MBOAT superfamily)
MFAFIPATLLLYYVSRAYFPLYVTTGVLTIASLVFYGYWKIDFLALILSSILVNYIIGWSIDRFYRLARKIFLILGVIFNLALIGYFKYAGFFMTNLRDLTGGEPWNVEILLPLAISFFTFQQIAYLVDVFNGKEAETNILKYSLFVSFFPQLIAGPIVHHKEMMPQFGAPISADKVYSNLVIGLAIFFFGLFKKVVIADGFAVYANLIFDGAAQGEVFSFFESWGGAFAYTLQIYFDFSGYSDMAVGLARMFGVVLPLNFFSPYKSKSIIEFWTRWHITLSRFLRDCLYIPLGGNKTGIKRRNFNIMITMLLGGLWHGAEWTFVLWGGFHGALIGVNHAWRRLHEFWPSIPLALRPIQTVIYVAITFICVALSWVIFRAESIATAFKVYAGMLGQNGFQVPEYWARLMNETFSLSVAGHKLPGFLETPIDNLSFMGVLLIVFFLPNTFQIFDSVQPVLQYPAFNRATPKFLMISWKENVIWAVLVSAMFLWTIFLMLQFDRQMEFLYFQF